MQIIVDSEEQANTFTLPPRSRSRFETLKEKVMLKAPLDYVKTVSVAVRFGQNREESLTKTSEVLGVVLSQWGRSSTA